METLLALLLSDKLGEAGGATLGDSSASTKSRTPELDTMRTRIRSELLAGHAAPQANGNGIKVAIPSATLPKS